MFKNRFLNRFLCAASAVSVIAVMVIPGNINGTVYTGPGAVTVMAAESGEEEAGTRPEAFDLRHVGGEVTYNDEKKQSEITGGDCYVTPVKNQGMFGTCWGFAAISAIETSILYQLGMTVDEYAEKYGSELDLSERALAYYAKSHLTEESGIESIFGSQAGEGDTYLYGGENNALFNTGGTATVASSILSTGSGLLYESQYPYRGNEGLTRYAYRNSAGFYRVTDENGSELLYFDTTGDDQDILDQGYTAVLYYDTENDDWSLPESDRYSTVVTLNETNILPSTVMSEVQYKDVEIEGEIMTEPVAVYTGIDNDTLDTVKDELLNGRAVTVFYAADTALATADPNTKHYINPDNYAHYTYECAQTDHAVTIVGYDDNYSKYNFLDHTDDENGDGEAHLPEGDGAWIVKNSWGAESEEFPNNGTWGADGSGYFYLSYYDRSIFCFETYTLDISQLTSDSLQYNIDEYDCMVAAGYASLTSDDDLAMSNVFCADSDRLLTGIGVTSASADSTIEAKIYLLNEEYTSPEDGQLICTLTEDYKYAGYHNIDLDPSEYTYLKKGTFYSVVVTEIVQSDSGEENAVSVGVGYSKENAEYYSRMNLLMGQTNISYDNAVVNPGESYVYMNGKWIDWSSESETEELKRSLPDYIQIVFDSDKLEEDYDNGKISEEECERIYNLETIEQVPEEYTRELVNYSMDNFPIKAFSEPVSGAVGKLSYFYNSDGVLTIAGKGDISQAKEGAYGFTPWFTLVCDARKIVIGKNITNVLDEEGNVNTALFLFSGWLQIGKSEDGKLYWVPPSEDTVAKDLEFTDPDTGIKYYADQDGIVTEVGD